MANGSSLAVYSSLRAVAETLGRTRAVVNKSYELSGHLNPHATLIASFPWYDLDEIRWATDALWDAIARNLRNAGVAGVPRNLDRTTHYETQWRSPDLLLSQACGYDVLLEHRERLQLVATPTYCAPGCLPGMYSSFIIVRSESAYESLEDLRGSRCVINTCTSHSGMNILRSIVAPIHQGGRFFKSVDVSGSHERSIERIRRGAADVAAIDCVTYELIRRHRPGELDGLRILLRTTPMPAPPFVTSTSRSQEALARILTAIRQAVIDPTLKAANAILMLESVEYVPLSQYHPISTSEAEVRRSGYREIPPTFNAKIGTQGYQSEANVVI